MTGARALGLALLAAGLGFGRPAKAFVRYTTETGAGFFWAQALVPLTGYPNDFVESPMDMTAEQAAGAAVAAAAAWGPVLNPCTYLQIGIAFSDDPTPVAGNDDRNSLIFRSSSWCQLGADGKTCEVDYDSSALAVTTDIADTRTGEIYDADIEVNVDGIRWADLVMNPSFTDDYDLQNALTHEMGHFIGLAHTCYNPLVDTFRPDDNTGQPIPDCDLASAAVQATTMFPSADVGDTQKRTLAPDDQNGVCTIYPASDPPPPDGSVVRGRTTLRLTCDLGAGSGGGALGGLGGLVGLCGLALRRRARRAARR